ncbi:glutathione-disulfide reductase [Hesseltinella vesiculosa]|uniref:Glutathione reductase n=1 Tax=Hesseltinella vesiculosa TaxID=101127 RepID=A0A1X2GSN7_9FUNG|nr:glutathione-disulfide reductase [Hesseltinella vesiculosa]
MAPIIKDPEQKKQYDLIVIGGGSGGMASARRAASYGAKVALLERDGYLGGTCVNVGCVPKKVMWNAASIAEAFHDAPGYCFEAAAPKLNWHQLKVKRDAYVKRLNGIYDNNLTKDHIDWFYGNGSFVDEHTIQVALPDGTSTTLQADRILVATGGHAIGPSIPGADLAIDSDGFFELPEQPKRVVVVGTGYIGIELAGIFHALGSDVTVVSRTQYILRKFDDTIRLNLMDEMKRVGVNFAVDAQVKSLAKQADGAIAVTLTSHDQDQVIEADTVLWAVGRGPNTAGLNLDKVGIQLDAKKQIVVDKYQATSVPHIFALGDVCGNYELTPVAIAAGRKLMDRLYGGEKFKNSRLEYENIPTVIFSHPTSGTIGLTEDEAVAQYGQGNIKAYTSKFINLYYGVLDHKQYTAYKVIVTGPEEKVVGVHLFGKGSDEILQGFGVAIRMGATMDDFRNVVAIHPTAAEELVTMR